MPFVGTPGEFGDLPGQSAVGVAVNGCELIAVVNGVGEIVRKVGVHAAALIDDTVIFHLHIGRRLKINPAFISHLRTVQKFTQNRVKQ
jgi:hypothetical protein